MPDSLATANDLRELALVYQQSRVLLTAIELDVFTAIARDRLSAGDVASSIGADPIGTERLLHALCALGLLQKHGRLFENGPAARRYLVKGEPDYVSLQFFSHGWDNWGYLTEAVRTGRPTVVNVSMTRPHVWIRALAVRVRRTAKRVWLVVSRSDTWLRAFVDYFRSNAQIKAPKVTAHLDLSGVSRVLDLGGGPAMYAMAIARARDDIRVTVFDRPDVVPFSRKNVSAAGLSDRIEAIGGDFLTDDLGSGYDLVFISEAVHANSGPENEALVRRAFDALNPGGRLVVHDYILHDDRTGPLFTTLFSLDMLISKEGGDTYTHADVRAWMTSAGLSDIEQSDTGAGTTLVVGRRPATAAK